MLIDWISKFGFLISHYAYLLIFIVSFLGIGHFILRKYIQFKFEDAVIDVALAIILGQGVFIVALQLLGVIGWLNMLCIGIVLVVGIAFSMVNYHRQNGVNKWLLSSTWRGLLVNEKLGILFLILFALPTLLEPLRPPWPGDEIQYHMPHIKAWAESGQLTVNHWLRYPWFPYNYNLLYASAMVMQDDVLPHFFNAIAGWLIAIMIYRLGKKHFNAATACIAVFIWISPHRGEFGKVNVDMGLTLYVLASSLAYVAWATHLKNNKLLYLAAFLLGVAIGSKYQGLFLIPLFLAGMLVLTKNYRTWLIAVIFMMLPCIYWYVRNIIYAGDPFAPLGGKYFGFTDWNMADYVFQFEDLKQAASWPHPLLWPALCCLWLLKRPSLTLKFIAVILCVYFSVVWYLSSKYPRYLMPIMPWLALFAAEYWRLAFSYISDHVLKLIKIKNAIIAVQALWALLFMSALLSMGAFIHYNWGNIAVNPSERIALLKREIKGFAVLEYANQHALGRIYNQGMSDRVYYAPQPIWGDVFGPWRYSDMVSSDAALFGQRLKRMNFDAVIVDEGLHNSLYQHPDFHQYFAVLFQNEGIQLYQLKPYK